MHYKSYWILQYSKIKKYLIKKHVDLKNTLIIEKSLCLFVLYRILKQYRWEDILIVLSIM